MAELNDIIIDLLHSQLYITDEQVKEARAKAAADNMSTIDALKELYGISEEELMMMVASIYGMETFDFSDYEVPKEAIEAVPAEVARRYGIMPVSKNGDIPTIAISDPSDLNLLDTINRILGSVDIVVSTKQQIAAAAKRAYATEDEQFVSVMESFAKNEDLRTALPCPSPGLACIEVQRMLASRSRNSSTVMPHCVQDALSQRRKDAEVVNGQLLHIQFPVFLAISAS